MKFKLTKRGKIVVVCLLLIVFVLIYSLVKAVTGSQSINDTENSKNVQTEIDESNTGELEDQSNLVENENTENKDENAPAENENTGSVEDTGAEEENNSDENTDSVEDTNAEEENNSDENTDSTKDTNEEDESDSVEEVDADNDEALDGTEGSDELENSEIIENSPELLEIVVENYFEDDFSIKEDENFDELEKLAQISIMNPSEIIVIEGHTNGYPNYNDGTIAYDLSNDRAQKVKEQLISFGVLEENIEILIVGSSQPKNTDGTAQHLNRRAVTYFKEAQNSKNIIDQYDVLTED